MTGRTAAHGGASSMMVVSPTAAHGLSHGAALVAMGRPRAPAALKFLFSHPNRMTGVSPSAQAGDDSPASALLDPFPKCTELLLKPQRFPLPYIFPIQLQQFFVRNALGVEKGAQDSGLFICGDRPHIHAEEKRVGVIDLFQLRREDFVAKYTIARRVIAPEQFREVKEVFLSTMLIIHEGDDLEQSDDRWRSHAVLDALCE